MEQSLSAWEDKEFVAILRFDASTLRFDPSTRLVDFNAVPCCAMPPCVSRMIMITRSVLLAERQSTRRYPY
eukprot:6052441-Prymnesium_polylepis.1